MHAHNHACTHTHAQDMYMHPYIHAYKWYIHTYTRYVHACMHVYILIYTYIHTYTHTYIVLFLLLFKPNVITFRSLEYDNGRGSSHGAVPCIPEVRPDAAAGPAPRPAALRHHRRGRPLRGRALHRRAHVSTRRPAGMCNTVVWFLGQNGVIPRSGSEM